MNGKTFILLGGAGVSLFAGPESLLLAREASLTGSMAMQQEYESNIFKEEDDPVEQWTTTLIPTLTYTSIGDKDSLSLTASSDLGWDQRLDEREFVHALSLSAERSLSQYVKVSLSDNYSYNDNPPREDMDLGLSLSRRFQRADRFEQSEVARLLFPELIYDPDRHYLQVLAEIERRYAQASLAVQQQVDGYLSNTSGRRRYWDNEIAISTEIEFAKDSILGLGYSYFINDDRDEAIDEYEEHSPYVSLLYRFNPQWSASARYGFIATSHDRSEDSREHDTILSVDYAINTTDQLGASYGFSTTDYDDDREDLLDQTATLSWNHDFSSKMRLTTSLDGSYLGREDFEDEREVGMAISVNRALRHGSFSLGAGTSMADEKTDGGWEDLREEWSLDAALGWELRKDLHSTVNAAYERRYQWQETIGKVTYDDYTAGASLSYTFMRWFTLSCRYTYNLLESDSMLLDDYDEHVVMLELSAAKELMRY